MKLAFCLMNYFPYGGLQRDCIGLAKEAVKRGHQVTVYTTRWEGEVPAWLSAQVIPVKGWQNHTRARHFAKKIQPLVRQGAYDWVVGFNKMPHLDVYYAADSCFREKLMKSRARWVSWLPRYQHYQAFEAAVFKKALPTKILLIAPKQQLAFQQHYQTESERFYVLPPGIAKDRIAPLNAQAIRDKMRAEGGVKPDELLLLMVGSGFKTKGLDRIIHALSALPASLKNRCKLWVIGDDHAEAFKRQAAALKVAERIQFLGGRKEVPAFLLSADFLLHPAYHENTGTVLLEALCAGLPVITTDVCGYAHYIQAAEAGHVLPSPFEQKIFNQVLETMLLSEQDRATWRQNAITFSKTADIYSMPERAIDILESLKRS